MARIDALPSLEIIRGLKGILDFYVWKGLPCVRAWPRWRPARQSDASKNAALLFGAVIKAFSLTHGTVLEQLELEATGIPRTARDLYVSGVYGNLHEASMSDFLDLLTECRDFLSALTAILDALHDVGLDEIDTHVEWSALPAGAATAAAQATQLTALQKLDDLQDALQSKALDRFLVRGMDQLHSFNSPLLSKKQSIISGANGWAASNPVPAGQIWVVTHCTAADLTSPTTNITHLATHDAVSAQFFTHTAAFAAGANSIAPCWLWLDPSDSIHCYFAGGLAGDTCDIALHGHIMTLET